MKRVSVAGKSAISLAVAMAFSILPFGDVSSHATTDGVALVNLHQTFTDPAGSIVITGIIGDYGSVVGADLKGNLSQKSPTPAVLFKLKKGTILVNTAEMNKALAVAPAVQNDTCSFSVSGKTLTLPIIKGTGAYKAITGKFNASVASGGITPTLTSGVNKGKCDFSNKYPPVASFFTLIASGAVSY